ncbi:phosphopantetheine-binding protein [Nostoc sp. ATCC 43529]|nr:phosphopantetheine-binding protein [Nostoc sp. ATCC 43529]
MGEIEVSQDNSPNNLPTETEIQNWLVSYIAELLEVDLDKIDITIPFDRYGLDSSAAMELSGELEDWLGRELAPTLLYDYPTIEALAKNLSAIN